MSRRGRPRTPLALRGLLQEPSVGVAVEIEAPPSAELRAPRVRLNAASLAPDVASVAQALAPPAPTRRADLDDGSVRILEHDLAPAVDVAPESLRTQVFAVRVERCAIPHVAPPVRAPLLEAPTTRPVRPPRHRRRAERCRMRRARCGCGRGPRSRWSAACCASA